MSDGVLASTQVLCGHKLLLNLRDKVIVLSSPFGQLQLWIISYVVLPSDQVDQSSAMPRRFMIVKCRLGRSRRLSGRVQARVPLEPEPRMVPK